MKKKKKIVVILGPTASGKTGLGVALARKFEGEIVSADSRQVYKGMDVGTGKDLANYKLQIKNYKLGKQKKQIIDITHHLIDIVNPKVKYNLARYQKDAYKAIDDILKRGKLPIVVGGTGLYLQAIVDDFKLSEKKPDEKLRLELEKKSVEVLWRMIDKLNPQMAEKINESDRKNKRRLIRYLEILKSDKEFKAGSGKGRYDVLLIGLTWPKEELEKRIYKRLVERLEKEDMIGEVKRLRKQGLSWKRLDSFGLEYRFISQYLQGKLEYDEMVEKLFIAIRQFAKRQTVWFRRWERMGRKIGWVINKKEAEGVVRQHLLRK